MRWLGWFAGCALLGLVAAGCSQDLVTSDRPSHLATQRAREMATAMGDGRGPVSLAWVPAAFPQRVDRHGPIGNEGAATEADVPTGVALAGRIEELLDQTAGLWADAPTAVTIFVIEARTEYAYSIGLDRHVTSAWCVFDAEFDAGDVHWQERFEAKARGDARGAGPIDRVWDDIALQVTASVLEHLPRTEPVAGYPESGEDMYFGPDQPGAGFPSEDPGGVPFFGVLVVTSNVAAAEVYVNGQFVGGAGSRLQLPPGDYAIEVRAAGRDPYRRDLHVLQGSEITIHAAFD